MQALFEMLRTRRPHGSRSERAFCGRWLPPTGAMPDAAGNYILDVGPADPTILWSSHTDTGHRKGGTQRIVLHAGQAQLAKNSKSDCLGADCTAGVWIMLEMIQANVPGRYVFHRGEEVGGLGSLAIAHAGTALRGITHAIAFDRRGTDSIVTHQGVRCCSNAFALDLAARLDMGHMPDSGGIFTDTANYVDLVPECTNVSVGYEAAHTSGETLDLDYLERLRDVVCTADFSDLTIVRDPLAAPVYGDHAPLDLPSLIAEYPDEVAAILEDHGITADDLRFYLWSEGIDLPHVALN